MVVSTGSRNWEPQVWGDAALPGVGDAAGEAVGAGVEAGELGLEGYAGLGDPVDHERLHLGPRCGTGSLDVAVVRSVVDDHVVARLAERVHVVGRVVHVAVGLHLGLGAEEADVAVGDARLVEPRHGVGHGHRVAPVHAQAMRDDADPHARVRQAPQAVGDARERGHVAEHPVLEHREPVQPIELVGAGDAPLGEVPGAGVAERLGIDPAVLGHHRSERARVVAAHAVEVHPEDEPSAHDGLTTRRPGSRGRRRCTRSPSGWRSGRRCGGSRAGRWGARRPAARRGRRSPCRRG